MIHTEPWFQQSSREGDTAIERLKRGDVQALQDIWKLGKRGILGVAPDFLVDIMTEKHGGKGFEWLAQMSRLSDSLEVPERPAPLRDFPRLYNAFHYLSMLTSASQHLAKPTLFPDPSNPPLGYPDIVHPNQLVSFWETTDAIFTTLDEEWDSFAKKYPELVKRI